VSKDNIPNDKRELFLTFMKGCRKECKKNKNWRLRLWPSGVWPPTKPLDPPFPFVPQTADQWQTFAVPDKIFDESKLPPRSEVPPTLDVPNPWTLNAQEQQRTTKQKSRQNAILADTNSTTWWVFWLTSSFANNWERLPWQPATNIIWLACQFDCINQKIIQQTLQHANTTRVQFQAQRQGSFAKLSNIEQI
jgi:hypothetical protein